MRSSTPWALRSLYGVWSILMQQKYFFIEIWAAQGVAIGLLFPKEEQRKGGSWQ